MQIWILSGNEIKFDYLTSWVLLETLGQPCRPDKRHTAILWPDWAYRLAPCTGSSTCPGLAHMQRALPTSPSHLPLTCRTHQLVWHGLQVACETEASAYAAWSKWGQFGAHAVYRSGPMWALHADCTLLCEASTLCPAMSFMQTRPIPHATCCTQGHFGVCRLSWFEPDHWAPQAISRTFPVLD